MVVSSSSTGWGRPEANASAFLELADAVVEVADAEPPESGGSRGSRVADEPVVGEEGPAAGAAVRGRAGVLLGVAAAVVAEVAVGCRSDSWPAPVPRSVRRAAWLREVGRLTGCQTDHGAHDAGRAQHRSARVVELTGRSLG